MYIISVNAYICYKNTFINQKKVNRLTFQQQIVAGLIGNYREGQGKPGPYSQSIRKVTHPYTLRTVVPERKILYSQKIRKFRTRKRW